jgi:hypothetical protein
MEAARTSETLVDNYFTRQYIPEDKSELHSSFILENSQVQISAREQATWLPVLVMLLSFSRQIPG